MNQPSNSLRRRLLQIVGLTAINWGLAGQFAGAQTARATGSLSTARLPAPRAAACKEKAPVYE